MIVARVFEFQAAHHLPRHRGRCRNLHGHGYRLEVHCEGPVDPDSGMLMDFADLKGVVQARVLDVLDHSLLNDHVENPTAENVAVWIWDRLREGDLPLAEVRLWETSACLVVYRGA